jgi:hypothetical protein
MIFLDDCDCGVPRAACVSARDAAAREIDLKSIAPVALGIAQHHIRCVSERRGNGGLTPQRSFSLWIAPRLVRDAAEREACLLDDVAVEFEPDCDGHKRERIREPVTDFQIRVVLRETLRRQLHRGYDLVGIETGVALRCISR